MGAGRRGERSSRLLSNITLAVVAFVFIPQSQPAAAQVDPTSLDPYGDSEQIRKDLDEILAQPEFRRLRTEAPQPSQSEMPEWLKKFLDWLGDLFRNAGSAFSGLGLLLQVLAYGILAAICCLIIWLVVKAVNRYRERHNTGLRGRATTKKEKPRSRRVICLPTNICGGRRSWPRKGCSARRSAS